MGSDAWIEIDGREGEGGGQVVRTAVGLAAVTGRAVRIQRVRGGRARPGLMRQHLAAVRAAATLCGAEVQGDTPGSDTLTFRPGPLRAGEHTFAVGSAGSAVLVCHAVLPALLCAPGPSRVRFEGGTHNPKAPSYECLAEALAPLLARLGARLTLALERPGFEPAGGGAFTLAVEPAPLTPSDLFERGAEVALSAEVLLAHLPFDVARRERAALCAGLGLPEDRVRPRMVPESRGPGNAVLVRAVAPALTEVFVAHGRVGVPAEAVAAAAIAECRGWLAAEVPVGPHLADQLLLPLALALREQTVGAEAGFLTVEPTEHTRTQAALIQRFLPVRVGLEAVRPGAFAARLVRTA